jgi:phage-related protein
MDKPDRIIYQGQRFAVEWYCDDQGKSQPYDYFLSISDKQQDKFFMLVKRMAEFGKIFDKTKFRNEGDDIYVFQPKPDHYLCFFVKGRKIVVVHAFSKKTDKMPAKEKQIAQTRMKIYLERNQ